MSTQAITTGYVDIEDTWFDWKIWVHRIGSYGLLVLGVLGMFRWDWNDLAILGILITSFIFNYVGEHLINYGFHRKTQEDHWDEAVEGLFDTRDRCNRWATIFWMLGFKERALTYIERADYAWLDAQITIADEESPYENGDW